MGDGRGRELPGYAGSGSGSGSGAVGKDNVSQRQRGWQWQWLLWWRLDSEVTRSCGTHPKDESRSVIRSWIRGHTGSAIEAWNRRQALAC